MTTENRFRLVRVDPLATNARLQHGTEQFEVVEFDPVPGKKYMVSIEVGDNGPSDVAMQLKRLHAMLKGFFPDGSVLIVPARHGEPVMGIYELDKLS
jgi:hypothetical protein